MSSMWMTVEKVEEKAEKKVEMKIERWGGKDPPAEVKATITPAPATLRASGLAGR
jgi:hypothetical protein